MKNIVLYLTSLVFLCSCCNGCATQKKVKTDCAQTSFKVMADDSIKTMIGDSLISAIFESDSARILELSVYPTISVQNGEELRQDTLVPFYDCYVKQDCGIISRQDLIPILFLLSDYTTYSTLNDVILLTPFTPSVAMRFYKDQYNVDIIFSFNGGMLRIYSTNNNLYKEFKYIPERLVIKYFQNFLQNPQIQKMINNNLI